MENRIIKFRAWDKEEKRMWHNAHNAYDYMHEEDCNKGDGIPASYFGEMLDYKDWIPMQYTGITDKNEVEIYEGDIVKYIDECSDEWIMSKEKIVGDVKYKGFQFVFQQLKENHKGGHYISNIDAMFVKEYEIIGNIYENPELIK